MNWISVKDRLPEDGNGILMYFYDGDIEFGFLNNGEWHYRGNCMKIGSVIEGDVHYWIYIDDIPKPE